MIAVSPGPGPLSGLAALLRSVHRLRKRIRDRKVMAHLASLDDRMLRDIGVTRLDVTAVSHQSWHGSPTALLRDRAWRP